MLVLISIHKYTFCALHNFALIIHGNTIHAKHVLSFTVTCIFRGWRLLSVFSPNYVHTYRPYPLSVYLNLSYVLHVFCSLLHLLCTPCQRTLATMHPRHPIQAFAISTMLLLLRVVCNRRQDRYSFHHKRPIVLTLRECAV